MYQPVLVIGLQPVDAAILEGEEGHGTVNFVIVFHGTDLVILGQALLQLGHQLIIGLITNTQHIHAVVAQFTAELPIIGGEIRGNKNKILHKINFSLLFLYTKSLPA